MHREYWLEEEASGSGAEEVEELLFLGGGKTMSMAYLIAHRVFREPTELVLVDECHRLFVQEGQSRASSLWRLGREFASGSVKEALRNSEQFLRAVPYECRRARATVSKEAKYRLLRRQAEASERAGKGKERRLVAGERRVRSSAARQAVLLRSGGRCESPECLMPDLPYRTKAGEALLEVDHIDDHAKGGRDHPSAMIALCPNCHRNKTHGKDGPALKERLRVAAKELDAALG